MLEKTKTPCKGCEDRHERCHSECERYKEFKAKDQAKKDALKQWKSETFSQRMSDPDIKLRKEKKRTK